LSERGAKIIRRVKERVDLNTESGIRSAVQVYGYLVFTSAGLMSVRKYWGRAVVVGARTKGRWWIRTSGEEAVLDGNPVARRNRDRGMNRVVKLSVLKIDIGTLSD